MSEEYKAMAQSNDSESPRPPNKPLPKFSGFNQDMVRDGHDPNVHIIQHSVHSDMEAYYLLTSDRHWDNPHSDLELQKAHLDWALKNKAGIIDIGDFFCAMQGRYDPRRARKEIRPEHDVPNYLDAIVDDAVDFFAPYARNFVLIGKGNHEQSILKNCETDLQGRLINRLNEKTGSRIRKGGYGGWIRFSFAWICEKSGSKSQAKSFDLYYHHGHGGGGPVTKGVIQHNRRAATYDADIIISGHIHESWCLTNMRAGLNHNGDRVLNKKQMHICLKTYKDEFGSGCDGWHIHQGRGPKPIGAWVLKFYTQKSNVVFTCYELEI